MPNDLYQWEKSGGLVHHCPQCFTPLTTPQARHRCLGEHVEWCKRYHTQLFKKGTSSSCDPCHRSDEEHLKRHREIAELLHELKQIKAVEQIRLTPLTSKNLNTVQTPEHSPSTKKERKAAKKAKKISELPKVISAADIAFVAKVLHSDGTEAEEADIERQLLEDPDIKLNRAFHRGTSNRREIRNEFVKKDKRGSKEEFRVDPEDLEGVLQLLNISPLTSSASAEEKTIYGKLKVCIEKDLVQVHKEMEVTMMRKAGFWRWASKKAYNRLIANGRIWGQKDGDTGTSSSAPSSASTGAGAETDEATEPDTDTDITTSSAAEDEELEIPMDGLDLEDSKSVSSTPKTPKTSQAKSEEEGWTTIGRTSKGKPPSLPINLKLAHNGGLGRMNSPITPAQRPRGFATMYD